MMQDIEDKLKELRGVLGSKADKLRLMYLSQSDPESKRVLESQINLLHAKHFSDETINLLPPPRHVALGDYPLGMVQFNNKNLYPFGLRERELPQHVIIAGRSGSGKSNTMLLMAKQFVAKKKPFMLFSFKREYRGLLECADSEASILAYTCGRNVADFRFNPLIIPKGTDRDTWINLMAEAISSVYFLGEGCISLIRKGLTYVYEHFSKPKIRHLRDWLDSLHQKQRRELDWITSTRRAVDAMCFGALGKVLNSDSPVDLEKLLDRQVVLEIDNFNDDDRTFVIQCVMRWVYRYALENFPKNDSRYALMVDEAHHIFLKKAADLQGKETFSDQILRMIRECSVGMILADQHPSLISLPALGNTFTTIGMNLKTRFDVNAIGNAMLLTDDQKDYLGKLPCGSAIVKLQDRFTEPFLIQIPRVRVEKAMTDEELRKYMERVGIGLATDFRDSIEKTGTSERVPQIPPQDEDKDLNELQHSFLVSVLQSPFIGASARYRQLQISTRHGNSVKDSLVSNGYLLPAMIHIHHNTMVLFELTEKAKAYLAEAGFEIKEDKHAGSIEHRFGIHYVKNHYQKHGFKVELEKKTANGKAIDLVATRDNEVVANQIETGKSDVKGNVAAAFEDGYSTVFVIATNYSALQKIKRELEGFQAGPSQRLEISYLLPHLEDPSENSHSLSQNKTAL